MNGRNWKNVAPESASGIRDLLLEAGAARHKITNPHEAWRVKLGDATFTYYTTGTLYGTPSAGGDPKVARVWDRIDRLLGSQYAAPDRDLLIGLDETGKGEIIGPLVLAGVIIHAPLFSELDRLIGPADTKKKHSPVYWNDLFLKLERLCSRGFSFIVREISPVLLDEQNFNRLMDAGYQEILKVLTKDTDVSRCRIVVDDYRLGRDFSRFLENLNRAGARIVVSTGSEDMYLETKTASLVSKFQRESILKRINEDKKFRIGGAGPGTGNAGDRNTLRWLEKWHRTGKNWPWFVRKSFKTITDIEGKPAAKKKNHPA